MPREPTGAALARTILQSYGVMVFQADRFHADPHPGNLIAMKGDRIGLVDFGEVGFVEPAERVAVLGDGHGGAQSKRRGPCGRGAFGQSNNADRGTEPSRGATLTAPRLCCRRHVCRT